MSVTPELDTLGLWKVARTLDQRPTCEGAARICSPCLQPTATTFASNVQQTVDLLLLPFKLAVAGANLEQSFLCAMEAMRPKHVPDIEGFRESAEVRNKVGEHIRELLRAPDTVDAAIKRAWQMLAFLVHEPANEASARALLGAGVAHVWAVYESVAKDVWTAAVNEAPQALAAGVIRTRASASSLGKSLAFGIIQKHQFDLRNSMGAILARDLDFTSASGIGRAFRLAFGKELSVSALLDRTELVELEATRHLVVHRAGIVDEQYNRRTRQTLPTGSTLQLDVDRIAPWINAAFETGLALLTFVDKWLKAHGGLR